MLVPIGTMVEIGKNLPPIGRPADSVYSLAQLEVMPVDQLDLRLQ